MKVRWNVVWVGVVLSVGVLGGCSDEPEPAGSTPAFASEEQAFAAAEQTYRNYVDALNAFREAETASVRPDSFLTGQALAIDIDTQRELSDQGLNIRGTTHVTATYPVSAVLDQVSPKVVLAVCLDSSDARVEDMSGKDVTPENRTEIYGLAVTFIESDGDLLISNSESAKDSSC